MVFNMPERDFIGIETDEMYTQYTDIVNDLIIIQKNYLLERRFFSLVIGMLFIIVAIKSNLKPITKLTES